MKNSSLNSIKYFFFSVILATFIYMVAGLGFPHHHAQAQNPADWRNFTPPFDYVGQVLEDDAGTIWVMSWTGTLGEETIPGSGLAKFEAGQWLTYTTQTTNGDLPGDSIHAALFDQQGHLWLAVAENQTVSQTVEPVDVGLVRFKPQEDSWQAFTEANTDGGLVSNSVRDIVTDEAGNIWVATVAGLSLYDGQSWRVVADSQALGATGALRLLLDSQHRLWVSLFEIENGVSVPGGVVYSNPLPANGQVDRPLRFTRLPELADNFVLSMVEDSEQRIWFGTLTGLRAIDGQTGDLLPDLAVNGAPNGVVSQLFAGDDGRLWAATTQGLQTYIDQNWQRLGDESPVLDLWLDSEGLLWLSQGPLGLQLFTGYRQRVFGEQTGDLPRNDLRQILLTAEGSIWVAGANSGLSRYQAGEWQNFNVTSGDLLSNRVDALLATTDGAIWVGLADAGISRYQDGTWQNFSQATDDLFSNEVCYLMETQEGAILALHWLTDQQGLMLCQAGASRYQDDEWDSLSYEAYEALNLQPVRESGATFREAITDQQGRLWRIVDNGVARQIPGYRPPWAELTMLNGQPLTTTNLTMPYYQRSAMRLGYTANDLVDSPERLQYRFRVDSSPVYQDWQAVAYGQEIVLSQLEPGEHTLALQAVDNDGNPSEPATLEVNVLQPVVPEPIYTLVNEVSLATPVVNLVAKETKAISVSFVLPAPDQRPYPQDLQYQFKLANAPVYTSWTATPYGGPIVLTGLEPGEYELQLQALDAAGPMTYESTPASLAINIMEATPTPGPTAVSTATPTSSLPQPLVSEETPAAPVRAISNYSLTPWLVGGLALAFVIWFGWSQWRQRIDE